MKRIILAICLLSLTVQAQPTDSTATKHKPVDGVLIPVPVYNEFLNYLGKFPFNDIVGVQIEMRKYGPGSWINADSIKADSSNTKLLIKKKSKI